MAGYSGGCHFEDLANAAGFIERQGLSVEDGERRNF